MSHAKSAKPASATQPALDSSEAIQLIDVTQSSGVTFVHNDGSSGQYLLPETMGGGLALFDYDGDGLIDILFTNGCSLESSPLLHPPISEPGSDSLASSASSAGLVLYRNLGDWRFVDVTHAAGLHTQSFGLGVTVGDYDNDGFVDIFLSAFGPNRLFHNDGSGSFTEATLGGAGEQRFSAGASFLDVDRDGNLDLFVANYVRLSPDDLDRQAALGRTIYPSPQDFRPESNQLFKNLGDGQWHDSSSSSQLERFEGTGMGCVTGDFDGDGDVDIYVANDELPNSLFLNDGQGVFDEAAIASGVALAGMGQASGSMGADIGDLDLDGRGDFLVTSFESEPVSVYRAKDGQVYQDVAQPSGAAQATLLPVTWGCALTDFEHDGDVDLFIATGHLDERRPEMYRPADLVLKNMWRETQQVRFQNVTASVGDVLQQLYCGRGASVADLDNDGDQDVVVLNLRDRPNLLENRSQPANHHWLQLQLIGRHCNRGAVGTKVRVVTDEITMSDEVRNGRGYQSYWGERLHFGLGETSSPLRLEITWADGGEQVVESQAVDQIVTIVQ